jgi:hypothetical protein
VKVDVVVVPRNQPAVVVGQPGQPGPIEFAALPTKQPNTIYVVV